MFRCEADFEFYCTVLHCTLCMLLQRIATVRVGAHRHLHRHRVFLRTHTVRLSDRQLARPCPAQCRHCRNKKASLSTRCSSEQILHSSLNYSAGSTKYPLRFPFCLCLCHCQSVPGLILPPASTSKMPRRKHATNSFVWITVGPSFDNQQILQRKPILNSLVRYFTENPAN